MKKTFRIEVLEGLSRVKNYSPEVLTESDIQHLPVLVQKYIRISGSLGKKKIINFRAEFKGGIRSKPGDDFMKLNSVQYNFMDNPTRIFYIVAKKKGIPAKGIHVYKNAKASMLIKLLGLFTVVDAKGKEMDKGETVTVFNDICFMAPAALIDRNIEWKEIDDKSVEAKYTNGDITICATLFFNDNGELINFISSDRFETTDGKNYYNYPWLTPVTSYKDINGFKLPSGAKLIYEHPEGEFCYGEFELVRIEYNCREFK